jgi:2,3-diketo-5-methylthio-1-phosphopentane phosphatase
MTRPRYTAAALFVDFDGTIVNTDTAQIALDRFGDPDWRRIDQALERGEVSFEESLRREFATLGAPPEAIIAEVERVTAIRPNFSRLIEYCRSTSLPLTVVSGGLDFCIRHFLDRDDWLSFVKIYAPTSHFTGSGYTLTFPTVIGDDTTNFKDGLVRHQKTNGTRVFFVGNGFGDLSAAKEATIAFAIKGSKLAELCLEQHVRHEEIDDFEQVVDVLSHRFLKM